jgi:hypothetical protein
MMGSMLCTGCGKQYKYCHRQEEKQSLKNSIENMIMVEQHINQIIKTQTKALVNSPTMITRCGWCTEAKKKEKVDVTIELAWWCNNV